MKLKVDKQAATVIKSMCDMALKAGGLQNLKLVTEVLNAMVIEEDPEPPKAEKNA